MLSHRKTANRDTISTVFIFPAQTPLLEDNELFFLFSIRQMISVLDQPRIIWEPDPSDGLFGKAWFRGKELPVLSLESCLGLPLLESSTAQRYIVMREVYADDTRKLQQMCALCKFSAAMRRLKLPLECHPIAIPDTIRHASHIKGAYKMEKSILLIVHLKRILDALRISEREAVYGN